MKNFILITVVLTTLLITIGAIKNHLEHNNFEKWVECLEASEYSDSECEECDYLYNRSGNFRLD